MNPFDLFAFLATWIKVAGVVLLMVVTVLAAIWDDGL